MSETTGRKLTRDQGRLQGPWARAGKLLSRARTNAATKGVDFALDREDIADAIRRGVCEFSGVPFALHYDHVWSSHPAAPSLDRKNPSLGYTRDNVQVVCWQINRMRGEFPDHMTRAFAQAFLNATHGESV